MGGSRRSHTANEEFFFMVRRPFDPRLVAVLVVAGALSVAPAARAGRPGPPERIVHPPDNGVRSVWTIQQPDIRRKDGKTYDIVIHPGDRVTISAGGCARRGGWP